VSIRGYKVVFRGEQPPDWNTMCSVLEGAAISDRYKAEFVLMEMAGPEAERVFDPGHRSEPADSL
jgi:hypothetical protein